ncbi:hypothetical protein [Shouchella lehensis]|uniref:Uncharacterized protein n=1 Tax=Shouchella lehensis TaxID=300825 RepID=A0A4Y7WDX4_9BACI|nr:hypothetical protein [Shouchella lehensis]MBG9783583.1 hypothetical protein [Shouchella lehensis]TES45661.1 hypothetical protein E2L03_19965 [Shouchella lehensis]
MELNDLKRRMNKSLEEHSKDDFYRYALKDAIDYVQTKCHQDFKNSEGIITLPGGVKRAVVKLVKLAEQKPNVQAISISGAVSESYFSSSDYDVVKFDLKPYIKAVFF